MRRAWAGDTAEGARGCSLRGGSRPARAGNPVHRGWGRSGEVVSGSVRAPGGTMGWMWVDFVRARRVLSGSDGDVKSLRKKMKKTE